MNSEIQKNKIYQHIFYLALSLLCVKTVFFVLSRSMRRELYFVSFVQDAALFGCAIFIACLAQRFGRKTRAGFIAYLFLYANFVFSFVYTFFLMDIYNFPVNVFAGSLGQLLFTAEYFLSLKICIPIVGVLLIQYFFMRRKEPKNWHKTWVKRTGIFIMSLFLLTLPMPALNPLVYSVQNEIMLLFNRDSTLKPLSMPTADISHAAEFQNMFLSWDNYSAEFQYKNIGIFVMEGLAYRDFMKAQATHDLFKRSAHMAVFDNYHTLNLDSYTSLIAILSGVFVPYQAYTQIDSYSFINRYENIAGMLKKSGYTTCYITSYGPQQERFTPFSDSWSRKIYMTQIEENKEFAAVTLNKIEYAAEDQAVLDDVVSVFKSVENTFVFQEMVFGHTEKWQELVKTDTVSYYCSYFEELIQKTEKAGVLDDTLFVIVSDHGPRIDQMNTPDYHIPLIFYSTRISEEHNNVFASHHNFRDIFLHYAANSSLDITPRRIFTVGNSGEFVYGCILPDGEHVFINNRMQYIKGTMRKEQIKDFSAEYQWYLNYFESRKQSSQQQTNVIQ